MDIAELERSLQARLDPAGLAVYADALQQRGDPRGELIAIDLAIDARGHTPELVERKAACIRGWLGESLAGRRWNPRRFRYGLYDDYTAAYRGNNAAFVRALYQSPVAPYVRGVALVAPSLPIDVIDQMVARPQSWLTRLRFQQFYEHGPSPAWAEAFPRCTPNVDELTLTHIGSFPRPVCDVDFNHPSVRTLKVGRWRDHLRLHDRFPALEELAPLYDDTDYVELLRDHPTVRRLDLSHTTLPIPDAPQLELVRLRAPSQDSARDALLEHIERTALHYDLVRDHEDFGVEPIVHPRVTTHERLPWPIGLALSDELWGRCFQLVVGTERVAVPLDDALSAMEAEFEELPPQGRMAWRAIWAVYRTADARDDDETAQAVPVTTWLDALADLDDLGGRFAPVVSALRQHVAPTASIDVTIA